MWQYFRWNKADIVSIWWIISLRQVPCAENKEKGILFISLMQWYYCGCNKCNNVVAFQRAKNKDRYVQIAHSLFRERAHEPTHAPHIQASFTEAAKKIDSEHFIIVFNERPDMVLLSKSGIKKEECPKWFLIIELKYCEWKNKIKLDHFEVFQGVETNRVLNWSMTS